ncbi:MAG: hypothetical protein ACLQOZ_06635 [Acidimicrobiales bacterium]
MNDGDLTMRARNAIMDVAADQAGLAVGPIQAVRGWGEILFVRVHAHLRGWPSHEARDVQELLQHRFQEAVREALDGDRCTVSVIWSTD